MLDTDPNPRSTYSNEPPAGDRNFYACGTLTRPGFQGVSHGWADTYIFFLGGQYFVLDGGDKQDPVPPGDYYIEVTVNPSFPPTSGQPCKLATDSNGQCHNFPEKSRSFSVNTSVTNGPRQVDQLSGSICHWPN